MFILFYLHQEGVDLRSLYEEFGFLKGTDLQGVNLYGADFSNAELA
ncbi:pentapeptide repeat-containing protein [Pontibacter sp. SD6]|uniref:Pentapeptide repeat-containing protein n=1 Tax=Pontibacter cellulosilyticus TaxID=1720253 RepID=A0A923N3Q4_9BACT|nr:pentapeptide repeat-containing protein [Pontibacter cellulosilyticus]